jgi:transcriptional regulator of acetoin/glycerol metabolism
LPESLIESELFGYEEGAFTGARRHGFKGLLREAHGGTLFLDEIGDMPLGLQPRLLRVLQEREVTPLGAARAVPIDFNLICATHRDLDHAMSAGTFRSDLYYRIAQYTHRLPDLCALPDRFALISEIWHDLAGTGGPVLAPETLALLVAYDWPGNFRQLTGTLRTLAVLAGAEAVVTPDLLPPAIMGRVARPPLPAVAGGGLEDITLAAMQSAVTSHGGNISRAARALGIHRSTLHRHLKGGRA